MADKGRSLGFDWLSHLHRNTQIKVPTVPLIVDRLIVLLQGDKPSDRIMAILPLLGKDIQKSENGHKMGKNLFWPNLQPC